MKANLDCINCTLGNIENRYDKFCNDADKKLAFMKEVYQLIGSASDDITVPDLSKRIDDILRERFDISAEFKEEKSSFNNLVLEIEDRLADEIKSSEDPLFTALEFSMTGNFIDFSGAFDVDPEKLYELIESSDFHRVEEEEYRYLRKDLENGENLVYLLDNAGEIVFDKLFIKTIKEIYPHINITAVVRGYPVLNDATYEDAVEVGLDKVVKVIDNGTAAPGTLLDKISESAKEAIDRADLIIAKGQGNIESLYGCGLNVYYMFLCKCDLFVRRFKAPHFAGLLKNELRMEEVE